MSYTVIIAVVTTLAVLLFGGTITNIGPWYRGLKKPAWNPPNWLFGPAWTVILALAAWAGVSAWNGTSDTGQHLRILLLFGVNIIFHVSWTPLFFNLQRPDWALVEVPLLWLSILALMIGLAPFSHLAVWLLCPYLAWVSFATILNAEIVRLNRPFAKRPGRV